MCMCVLPVSYPFCNDIVLVEIGVFKPQLFFASRTAATGETVAGSKGAAYSLFQLRSWR